MFLGKLIRHCWLSQSLVYDKNGKIFFVKGAPGGVHLQMEFFFFLVTLEIKKKKKK